MAICECCGKEFNTEDAKDYFEEEFLLSYDNLRKCLCGECAVQAINDMEEDVYFETCEDCGKTFDLIKEESEFDSHFSSYNGIGLRDVWMQYGPVLCSECAIDRLDSEDNKYGNEDEE